MVNCRVEALVLVAVPPAAQRVPGTYSIVLTVEVLATDAAAAVTVTGSVRKPVFESAFTPVAAVVRSAAAAGNAPPGLLFDHSVTADA